MNDYTLPVYSLVHGRKAERMVRRLFGNTTIEALPRDFFAVATDLVSGKLSVHRRGPLYVAVGASFCLPGIGAPVATDGKLLLDGGGARQPAGRSDERHRRGTDGGGGRDRPLPAAAAKRPLLPVTCESAGGAGAQACGSR